MHFKRKINVKFLQFFQSKSLQKTWLYIYVNVSITYLENILQTNYIQIYQQEANIRYAFCVSFIEITIISSSRFSIVLSRTT